MSVHAVTTETDREPERTCVGCRQKDAKEALLRFAIAPGGAAIAPDPVARLGGRGVSVHPTRKCLELAVRRGGLAKAIHDAGGKPGKLDAAELAGQAAALYEARALALLGSGRRAGRLAVGTDAVRESFRDGTIATLVVAEDAAGRRDELMDQAARLSRRCVVLGTKASLGAALGREEVGVVAILDAGIGAALAGAVARAEALREVE